MENKLNINQKIELAWWICEHNDALLTGSLMLWLLGIDLGRVPDDIDIIIDECTWEEDSLVLPPFCRELEVMKKDDYDVLKRVEFMGCKIEFLAGSYKTLRHRHHKIQLDNSYFTNNDIVENAKKNNNAFKYYILNDPHSNRSIYVALLKDLIKAKQEYIENDNNEIYKEKCKKDLEIINNWIKDNSDYIKEEEQFEDLKYITYKDNDFYNNIDFSEFEELAENELNDTLSNPLESFLNKL